LTTGKRLAVHVGCPQLHVKSITRAYDSTGHPLWEREQSLPETGGRAAGAANDAWLKQIKRTFDPATGKKLLEETFASMAASR